MVYFRDVNGNYISVREIRTYNNNTFFVLFFLEKDNPWSDNNSVASYIYIYI